MSRLKDPGKRRDAGMEAERWRCLAQTDAIADDEEDWPSPYEPTYRDGSVKNECWNGRDSE